MNDSNNNTTNNSATFGQNNNLASVPNNFNNNMNNNVVSNNQVNILPQNEISMSQNQGLAQIQNDFSLDNNINMGIPNNVGNDINNVYTNNNTNINTNTNVNTDTISNNGSANPILANYTPINNANSTMQSNSNENNNISLQQSYVSTNQTDDELLRAFIGNNYEKITTGSFNIAGFFLTSLYMFYRKMFGFGLLAFIFSFIMSFFIVGIKLVVNITFLNSIVSIILTIICSIIFNVIVGFLVNKIYLSYAKKKVNKIKLKNSQKSIEELKTICSNKGGTSIGMAFLGFFTEIGITVLVIVIMVIYYFVTIKNAVNGPKLPNISPDIIINDKYKENFVEDIKFNGYTCYYSNCSVFVVDENGDTNEWELSVDNYELVRELGNYSDYIKVDVYYTINNEEKIIFKYKIYLRSTGEDVSDVKTESELRDKIGFYSVGVHTDLLTLTKISEYISYTDYIFVDSKNIKYEMKYMGDNDTLNLVKGNKYNVTFEVVHDDDFGYEINIISVN